MAETGRPSNNPNGRPPGSQNKRSGMLRDQLAAMGCKPMEILAKIAMNDVPCGVCRGKLKTKFKLEPGQHAKECASNGDGPVCDCNSFGERVCQSCYGQGMEAVNPELRFKAGAELLGYIEAKRKAVEISADDSEGGGIRFIVELAK